MAGYLATNSDGEYILDFSSLISGEKKSLPFEIEIDFPPFEKDIISCVSRFKGSVDDKNEEFVLSFSADAKLLVLCSRCAEEMKFDVNESFSIPLCGKKPERNTEEAEVFKKGKVNLSETVREFLILSLPTQFLCKDDCAGLCPVCGGNLNEKSCGCETKEIDSRLTPLAELLKAFEDEE